MNGCNTKPTPCLTSVSLHPPDEFNTPVPEKRQLFLQIVGDLRYIADSTRPDIMFTVNRLAQALQNPTTRHWNILKNPIRYLKGTVHRGILFNKSTFNTFYNFTDNSQSQISHLTTYSDSDFANDKVDRKSISGHVHIFYGSPVTWSSTKQNIQALSTCEAEYLAASHAVQTSLWLRQLLLSLNILPSCPTTLNIDNSASVNIANNIGPTKRRKYIDIRHHHLREHVQKKNITVKHVSSSQMLADLLTKPLAKIKFNRILKQLNICDT